MTTGVRLTVRPRPEFDESLRGYVVRLAEANHCESRTALSFLLGTSDPAALITSENSIVALIRATGWMYADFDMMTHLPLGDDLLRYGNSVMERGDLRLRERAICPRCMAESPYQRRYWDHRAVAACPLHRTYLVDTCCCHRPIAWDQVDRCQGCGWPYSTLPTARRAGDFSAHRELMMRAIGETLLDAGLARIELPALLRLAHFLGDPGGERRRLRIYPDWSVPRFAGIDTGWSVIRQGRDALFRELDHIFEPQGRLSVRRYPFLTFVSRSQDSFPHFMELFRTYVGARPQWSRQWQGFELLKGVQQRTVRLHVIATQLGIPSIVLRAWSQDLQDRSGAGRCGIQLGVRTAQRWVRDLDHGVSLKDVARALGTTVDRCRGLVSAGLLRPVRETADGEAGTELFSLDEFRRVWRALVPPTAKVVAFRGHLYGFHQAFPMARDDGCAFIEFIRLAMAGEVQVRAVLAGRCGIGALLFDAAEADVVWKRYLREAVAWLRIGEAGRVLQLPSASVQVLIRAGRLEAQPPSGLKICCIPRVSVDSVLAAAGRYRRLTTAAAAASGVVDAAVIGREPASGALLIDGQFASGFPLGSNAQAQQRVDAVLAARHRSRGAAAGRTASV